jgi:hypothetical protein
MGMPHGVAGILQATQEGNQGRQPAQERMNLLAEAGFVEGRIHDWTGYHTSGCTEGRSSRPGYQRKRNRDYEEDIQDALAGVWDYLGR